MKPRLARCDETAALWRIRNLAIRHGCQGVYPAEVINAWTPDALPAGYFAAVKRNPFFVIDDPEQAWPLPDFSISITAA